MRGRLGRRLASFALTLGLCSSLAVVNTTLAAGEARAAGRSACASPDESVRSAAEVNPAVPFGKWQGTGYGGFLVPENLDVSDDGGVDVLVHFNGAMMTDADYRQSKTNAIVMSIAINEIVGSAGYARMFEDPGHMDRVLDSLFATLKKSTKKKLHLRRLGLVSWSAGMGAVGKLLRSPKWSARIDTVVLLDSLHTGYLGKDGRALVKNEQHAAMGLGEGAVDKKSLEPFVQFAKEAAAGKKTFVLSASAIVPPDYASASETGRALFTLLAGKSVSDANDFDDTKPTRPMTLRFRGDVGNFHVLGWKGGGKRDHFDQLHLVGDILREHVGHRWFELARKERADRTS